MNLIPVIREALGLQENEEFKLIPKFISGEYCVEDKYRFTNDTFQRKDDGKWKDGLYSILLNIILDNYEVVKPPFKPNEHESYWFVNLHSGTVDWRPFNKDFTADGIRANGGNCYRTLEEAKEHVNEWMEKLYGKEWRKLYEPDTDD